MFVSQYNTFTNLRDDKKYIAFNGITGALDIFSEDFVNKLTEISKINTKVTNDDFDDENLEYLLERGYITDIDFKGEEKLVKAIAIQKYSKLKYLTPTVEIIPSYDCQLRCRYCFEKEARANGGKNGWLSKIMTKKSVDFAFDSIDRLFKGKNKRRIGIYGGEPFKISNKECLEYIIGTGNKRGYQFLVTTNGVDLDKYTEMLHKKKISLVRVTLNGYRDSHDKNRIYSDGRPTFSRIMKNLRLLLQQDIEIQIRVDVTKDALDSLEYLADELIKIGFTEHPNAQCFCMAVHPHCDPATAMASDSIYISEAELVKFLDMHPALDNIFHPSYLYSPRIKSLFENNIEAALSPIFCDAQTGIYVFDPFGNIYPCNKVVGISKYSIGTYIPELSISDKLSEKWLKHSIQNRPQCIKCKFALICGGGCLYLQSIINSRPFKDSCLEYKNSFESMIRYYYKRFCPNPCHPKISTCVQLRH